MKIIFSRKGFDSQFGKQPSPVLPDGTLLSFPIPRKAENLTFGDISYQNQSYFDIIHGLNRNTIIKANETCHLDPDIRRDITTPFPPNRVCIFGQCNAALTLLNKYAVKEDDLFLFFGWFKETEYDADGVLRYKRQAPDLHLIYGYLQIGEILFCGNDYPAYAKHHPHAGNNFAALTNNAMYVAKHTFSMDESLPGSGCLKYSSDAVLTAEGMTRSRWKPYSFLKELPMTYHTGSSFKETYFQSAAQGQEFIISANEEIINWVKRLITNNRDDAA